MAAEDHESVATAPWLQGASPDYSGLSIERMPGLAYALEQFALGAPDALAPLCKASASGAIDELRSTTLFQFIGESEGLAAAVLACPALDAKMLLIFDPQIIETLVAAVLGAGPEGAPPVRPRPGRTGIEAGLLTELARHLTTALNKGFDQSASLGLTFESVETLVDVYALGRRDMPAIAAKVTVELAGGPAPLTFLFPQSLLLPVRKKLSVDPSSEAPSSDPRWMRDLEAGVTKTPVAVTAILDEFPLTLGDIADFSIGKVLTLEGAGLGRVRLECAGREIFWCKLGENDGRYALEIEEPIVPESESAEEASIH